MKITEARHYLVDNVAPYRGGRQFLFFELYTDEGIVGIGERPTGSREQSEVPNQTLSRACR